MLPKVLCALHSGLALRQSICGLIENFLKTSIRERLLVQLMLRNRPHGMGRFGMDLPGMSNVLLVSLSADQDVSGALLAGRPQGSAEVQQCPSPAAEYAPHASVSTAALAESFLL